MSRVEVMFPHALFAILSRVGFGWDRCGLLNPVSWRVWKRLRSLGHRPDNIDIHNLIGPPCRRGPGRGAGSLRGQPCGRGGSGLSRTLWISGFPRSDSLSGDYVRAGPTPGLTGKLSYSHLETDDFRKPDPGAPRHFRFVLKGARLRALGGMDAKSEVIADVIRRGHLNPDLSLMVGDRRPGRAGSTSEWHSDNRRLMGLRQPG